MVELLFQNALTNYASLSKLTFLGSWDFWKKVQRPQNIFFGKSGGGTSKNVEIKTCWRNLKMGGCGCGGEGREGGANFAQWSRTRPSGSQPQGRGFDSSPPRGEEIYEIDEINGIN